MMRIMKVLCPRCKRETEYSRGNPSRPFCSERCNLIDLGQWVDGAYAIPVADASELGSSGPDDERIESAETPRLSPTDPGKLH